MSTQPQPGEIWRHKSNCDQVLFIGRCREGCLAWQAVTNPIIQAMDLDWTGWERVGTVFPRVKPGWLVKCAYGLELYDKKPEYNELNGDWICVEGSFADAHCLVDPWPDEPNGGPECILEVK